MEMNFESVRTPSDLLKFLSTNIRYGFVRRSDGEILNNPGDKAWQDCWLSEYFLQKPEELLKTKNGVCWDFVELERDWFKSLSFEIKTYYMTVVKKGGSNLPTHTFLAYFENNKWCWFEYSWYKERGIHEYEKLDDLIRDVKERHIQSILLKGATQEDTENHRVYEYEGVDFGVGPMEYVMKIMNGNKRII